MFIHILSYIYGFRFLYSDVCDVNDDTVFKILYAAKRYDVSELEVFCSNFIKTKLSDGNLIFYTNQALEFDAKEYLKMCHEYFERRIVTIIDSKEILEAPQKVLLTFCEVKKDSHTEVTYFSTCMKWAKVECKKQDMVDNPVNLRKVLGDIVTQINYGNMSLNDFYNTVLTKNILTTEEAGQAIMNIRDKAMIPVSA